MTTMSWRWRCAGMASLLCVYARRQLRKPNPFGVARATGNKVERVRTGTRLWTFIPKVTNGTTSEKFGSSAPFPVCGLASFYGING